MNNKRFRKFLLLGLVAPFASASAWATTNTVAAVTTTLTGGISDAYDTAFAIGIAVLAIGLVVSFILKGLRVKRG